MVNRSPIVGEAFEAFNFSGAEQLLVLFFLQEKSETVKKENRKNGMYFISFGF
jgi:hypothetical protein